MFQNDIIRPELHEQELSEPKSFEKIGVFDKYKRPDRKSTRLNSSHIP